jgi:hypothetical protein
MDIIPSGAINGNKMGDLLKHITEKILDGEFTNYEERRPHYPLPSFEDWCAARGFDRPGVEQGKGEDGKVLESTDQGKQKTHL